MSSTESTASSTKGRFYHELVTVKVEGVVHRVPKYYLETWSTVFRDMFKLPQGADAEGKSEENPIILSGCTNAEFESLMDVLLTPGAIEPLNLTKEQWVSVLKLSTIWEIPKARTLSVAKLKTMSIPPVELVKLGREYKVTSLFVDGCIALARQQHDPQQLEELATALGWDVAARIMWAISSRSRHPTSIFGVPRNLAKCLSCSATLVMQEASESAPPVNFGAGGASHPVISAHGPTGYTMVPPLIHPNPHLHGPGPHVHLTAPTTVGPGTNVHLLHPNGTSQQLMLQAQQQTLLGQQQMLGRRSLLIKYTCPSPSCRGPTSTHSVLLDVAELSGSPLGLSDLSDTIEEIFEDEMRDMY